MQYTATYSPEDNKLRLYASSRLDAETYQRVKAAGFKWAPKQQLFVAPAWSPSREDLLIELCGEIDDEDTSLVERAEERAERFGDYSDSRREDAEQARAAVAAIADNIPFGQPILVGHHSERRARKDAEKIQDGMRKAVKMWDQAQYWQDRAKGALRHAKYKERPDVRARRIKGIEADKRKIEREISHAAACLKFWQRDGITLEQALLVTNAKDHCGCTLNGETYWSAWGALKDGKITVDEIRAQRMESLPQMITFRGRWVSHYENRLAYERAMLAEDGGTVAQQKGLEVGGGCKCWASPRGGWSYIQKLNKVSVTVLDNWGNGGRNFTRTIPFDKLTEVMTKAEVEQARTDGRLIELEDKTGFGLLDSGAPGRSEQPHAEAVATREPEQPQDFQAMRESLRAGVQVVTAPQLFATPRPLALRMAHLAQIGRGTRILEPSAGTGNLIDAIRNTARGYSLTAVEINCTMADRLRSILEVDDTHQGDFLQQNGNLGKFDRIVMNPPFQNGADIKHIQHALGFLKPGGRLVAICANGPRQQEQLKPLADTWEELPADTFKDQGTNVRAALLTIRV